MTTQTNTEVAGVLLDGVTADIWCDASEYRDSSAATQIAVVQDAMTEAAHRLGLADEMLKALQRLTHPMADDSDVDNALAVIAKVTGA